MGTHLDIQSYMVSMFNIIAVHDRVDSSQLHDTPAIADISGVRVQQVLPTTEDHKCIIIVIHVPGGTYPGEAHGFFLQVWS